MLHGCNGRSPLRSSSRKASTARYLVRVRVRVRPRVGVGVRVRVRGLQGTTRRG